MLVALQLQVARDAVDSFMDDLAAAAPKLLAAVVFLVVVAVLIKLVMVVVRAGLRRAFPDQSPVYRQFVAAIVATLLWFGAALSLLSLLGLTAVAASLGTASGFLALGVAYALSGMIADAVSGVYLLRDPDFMPGDRIRVKGTDATVEEIEIRKTRLAVEQGTWVLANSDIEGEWTKLDGV